MMDVKTCIKCEETKLEDKFYWRRKGAPRCGRNNTCKACMILITQAAYRRTKLRKLAAVKY